MTVEATPVPSREEVEDLKRQWYRDPAWDIEETEGFEAHRDELTAYHEACRVEWDLAYTLHRIKATRFIPLTRVFAPTQETYVRALAIVLVQAYHVELEGGPATLISFDSGEPMYVRESVTDVLLAIEEAQRIEAQP